MKVLIVEDEEPARQLLKIYLKDYADCELVGEAPDGFEGFRLIKELKPDLVFLDIQMPRITGFELLELLDEPPIVIFATAYDQFALKAFEKNAADYLLKPYSKERFRQAIEKVRQRIASKATNSELSVEKNIAQEVREQSETLQRIPVKVRNKVHVIPTESILYIEAEGDYVFLHTPEGRFLKEATMKHLESHLPPERFIRIHRSAIVHVDAIKGLEQTTPDVWHVVLKNGLTVRASTEGRRVLKKVLGI